MKKFIFGLFAIALFAATSPTTVQADNGTTTENLCYDSAGNQIVCATGDGMGQPKKKRKKR